MNPQRYRVIFSQVGLVVNGLTLTNAAGLTLAGGQPSYRADGSLKAFRVQGAIQLAGRGLDAAQADHAQALARAIALNAGIWAQDLRVVTGSNHLAADSTPQPLHADSAPAEAGKPQFALDVAQLGGMYARKIMLIGTGAGLGVRNGGVLLADAGPLTLSTNGQLRNAGVIASQGADAELQLSARGIDNGGRLGSQCDMVLADGGAETLNAGSIEAGRELVAQAGQLVNQAGGMITAPRLDIMAARLDNAGHIAQTGPQALAIHSFTNSAVAHLGRLHSEGLLDNRKGTLQMQRLTGAQAAVLNQGGSIHVPRDLRLVAGQLDNTGGAIASARHLNVEVPAVTNSAGTLSAGGHLTVQGQTLENQRNARLVSQAGRMRLTLGGAFDNPQGRATAQQGLEIGSASLNNAGGTLRTMGERSPLTITSGAGVDNSGGGLIQSSGDLQLFAGAEPISNSTGSMLAQQDLVIQSRGLVDNSRGQLQAGQKLSLQDAGVAAGANLSQATQTLSNQGGTVFSSNTLEIRNQGIAAAGRMDAQGDMTLNFAKGITSQGTIATNGKLQLETAGHLTNQAQLLGGSSTEVAATHIDNQHGAQISARQGTTLRATLALTNRGLLNGQDTRLDADTVDNLGTGRIYGDHVSIAAQKLQNLAEDGAATAPVIAARQELDLGVPVIVNKNGVLLQSLGDMRFGASLDTHRNAAGNGQELRNIGARVDSQGNIKFDKRHVGNLNAGPEINPLAEEESQSGLNLIAFPGRAPDDADRYREVGKGKFIPKNNASQFPISEKELRQVLQSEAVVKTPISRVIDSEIGKRYVREVDSGRPIGIEKYDNWKPASSITVMTHSYENIVTAFPVLK